MDDYYTADSLENSTDFFRDLEEDPFNPYEYELSIYDHIYFFVLEYLVSIAHLLLCVAISIASSLFFYSFYKFKRLQTRTNYILLNFYICITMASVFLTVTLILESSLVNRHYHVFVLLFTLTFAFINGALILALLLAQDWILSVSNTRCAQKYQNCYKWMIGGVYLFALSHLVLYFTLKKDVPLAISAITCAIIYLINVLVLIVFNVIRYKKKYTEESKQILYALNVASVYHLIWLPPLTLLFISFLIALFAVRIPFSLAVIMSCVMYFFEFISFSAPVVIVYLLPKWDKNFKMAYDYVFKRSIRRYQPNGDNLDEV